MMGANFYHPGQFCINRMLLGVLLSFSWHLDWFECFSFRFEFQAVWSDAHHLPICESRTDIVSWVVLLVSIRFVHKVSEECDWHCLVESLAVGYRMMFWRQVWKKMKTYDREIASLLHTETFIMRLEERSKLGALNSSSLMLLHFSTWERLFQGYGSTSTSPSSDRGLDERNRGILKEKKLGFD